MDLEKFQLARQIWREDQSLNRPLTGKEIVGRLVGSMPTRVSEMRARYEGETRGHSRHEEYRFLRDIVRKNPGWSHNQLAGALGALDRPVARNNSSARLGGKEQPKKIGVDRARRWVAWWLGATQRAPELRPKKNWKEKLKPGPRKMSSKNLYARAETILRRQPDIGMQALAWELPCRTSRARILREEIRGRLFGHSADRKYQEVARLLANTHSSPGPETIAVECKITPTMARVHLARYRGATHREALGYQGMPARHEEAPARYCQRSMSPIQPRCMGTLFDGTIWVPTGPGQMVAVRELYNELLRSFEAAGALRPIISYTSGAGHLFVINVTDAHLGKYFPTDRWGQANSLKTACQGILQAIDGIISLAAIYKPEQIVLAWGGDFFDFDAHLEPGRWREVFLAGRTLTVRVVEHCRRLAPVHIVLVQGNHAPNGTFHLFDSVTSYFRRTPGVTIDDGTDELKFFRWGRTLLSWAHGDRPHEHLVQTVLQKQREEWREVPVWTELQVGHYHVRHKKFYTDEKEERGLHLRQVPALCSGGNNDGIKQVRRPAAQGYVYHIETGYVAELVKPVTIDAKDKRT